MPQLLFFVLHDKRGQTIMAALYEKDAENYGEEGALIIWTRCQKNLEKRRKMSCNEGSKEEAKWNWEKTPSPVFKGAQA